MREDALRSGPLSLWSVTWTVRLQMWAIGIGVVVIVIIIIIGESVLRSAELSLHAPASLARRVSFFLVSECPKHE